MKFILITQRIEQIKAYRETRDALDTRWTSTLLSAGFFPIIVPNNLDYLNKLLKTPVIITKLSGIILSGGNDNIIRNEVELGLLNWAIKNNIPVLGICHGMQIIQKHYNNAVYKIDNHINVKHKIVSIYGGGLNPFIQQLNQETTYHQYGTNMTSKPLEALAKSSDGVIMAIKHQNKNIYGFMWHPERSHNTQLQQQMLRYIF